MIEITNKKNCVGCTACAEICPKDCIRMKPDEEVFLYPAVGAFTAIATTVLKKVEWYLVLHTMKIFRSIVL